MKNSDIVLLRRYGDFRVYSLKNAVLKCEIKLCLNRNVHQTPGYYLTFGQCFPDYLMQRRFSSGKRAAQAALSYLLKFKNFPVNPL